ncbi:MAG: LysR substrate-binding domain-containing protein [Oxalicibacterium faecigallinarum]|uniref:Isoleucine biosynthesis transcriptional activator n=1 Tax=Oxalicibacterium faecigallinarum TaxID=573741 RepID=A0A8J3ATX6_9BURK|nr:LysR substrate-binding domain-containing protein [Oxalicibacterium faecigallinarum]MDQ7969745.1 LysR substrate-binding domain-containing protein [Oxalicibacterium faecigallinarum]GGI20520.1 isoleucine biosynthesis transcriptional activator [Oxalicibacterium faecigallinarum]
MNIELRQLRYFIAVAEEMHFGRAAQRLHMTQPPLSLAIRSLESALGVALFRRNNRNVALTPAGIALLPEAQRILQQTAALPDLMRRAASGASGSLSLAFVSTADYSVLPSFLREFRETYPAVDIDLREATTDVQLDELMQGRIDVSLLIPPLPEKARLEIDYLPVLSEPLILAAPKGLPALRGKTRASLQTLTDQPLIIFPRRIAPALHDAILACYHEAGLTPHIGQEAIQMQTIIGLVSAGMGIALVPQSVSNLKRPGVDYRPLTNKTPLVETGLAWRRDNTSPVLRAFLELLRKK